MNAVPGQFQLLTGPGFAAWVRPEAADWVEQTLGTEDTLYRAAARQDRRLVLQGRLPAFAVPMGEERWVVRHFHRGGFMARLLGDRYVRLGAPRPFREATAGLEVGSRGIHTPDILAAVVYPAGIWYRGDLVTRFVEGSQDLAAVLFGPEPPRGGRTRREVLREAGRLIRELDRRGIHHPDLNAKNILVEWRGDGLRAWLLDLDRCQVSGEGQASGTASRMHRRLGRSLEKLSRRYRRDLEQGEWRALAEGVEES